MRGDRPLLDAEAPVPRRSPLRAPQQVRPCPRPARPGAAGFCCQPWAGTQWSQAVIGSSQKAPGVSTQRRLFINCQVGWGLSLAGGAHHLPVSWEQGFCAQGSSPGPPCSKTLRLGSLTPALETSFLSFLMRESWRWETLVGAHVPPIPCRSQVSFPGFFCSGGLVAQLCLTLFVTPWTVTCQTPLSEISQARLLEWVAIPFSRGSSQLRDGTQVSCLAGGFFTN